MCLKLIDMYTCTFASQSCWYVCSYQLSHYSTYSSTLLCQIKMCTLIFVYQEPIGIQIHVHVHIYNISLFLQKS